MVVAIGALVVFLVFEVYLIGQSRTGQARWARLVSLFAPVQAIAAAAAGALFGNRVQLRRAEHAEADAREKGDEASRGRALAAALKAEAPQGGSQGGVERLGPSEEGSVAARHAALARELFP